MRQPCRCRRKRCQMRVVLRKALSKYLRPPLCRCGGRLRVDKYRSSGREKKAQKTCDCHGYNFKHRRNSRWCIHNPNYPEDPSGSVGPEIEVIEYSDAGSDAGDDWWID